MEVDVREAMVLVVPVAVAAGGASEDATFSRAFLLTEVEAEEKPPASPPEAMAAAADV